MSEKWIWLPDWASNLGIWEDDLMDVAPSANHIYVQYSQLAEFLEHPMDIPELKKSSTVVAWGLGALSLLCSGAGPQKGQKWILLSPFANFCDEEGPWNSENLLFKAREMHSSLDVGLKAFKEQFDDEFSDWPEEWLDAARKMDATLLADGLKFLAAQRIENVVENSEDIQVLFGRMDQDVTPAMTLRLKEFLPKATFKERPKSGHWPPMMLF